VLQLKFQSKTGKKLSAKMHPNSSILSPTMQSLQLLDYSTANSIERFIQYYTFFSTIGLLMSVLRFFFYNFFTPDNKDMDMDNLRTDVENLQNILEEVVKHLNRNRNNYDEEKADFVDAEEEDEKKSSEEEKKIN